jgi:hypothetical protein
MESGLKELKIRLSFMNVRNAGSGRFFLIPRKMSAGVNCGAKKSWRENVRVHHAVVLGTPCRDKPGAKNVQSAIIGLIESTAKKTKIA